MKSDRAGRAVGDYLRQIALVDRIKEAQDERGLLPPCEKCPLRLLCTMGKSIHDVLWCTECKTYFVPNLGKRIDCDVLEIHHVVETGGCPCRSGIPSEIIFGVQVLDRPTK
jgi:hypothetical protein